MNKTDIAKIKPLLDAATGDTWEVVETARGRASPRKHLRSPEGWLVDRTVEKRGWYSYHHVTLRHESYPHWRTHKWEFEGRGWIEKATEKIVEVIQPE